MVEHAGEKIGKNPLVNSKLDIWKKQLTEFSRTLKDDISVK